MTAGHSSNALISQCPLLNNRNRPGLTLKSFEQVITSHLHGIRCTCVSLLETQVSSLGEGFNGQEHCNGRLDLRKALLMNSYALLMNGIYYARKCNRHNKCR
ncbi:hypothetical protein TNCT_141321 [Trichonephila clavata]|uniref:Uncharacterized protein n=1 Tax=Trichonephila clavata TaxID=2740835 RepID=A0A8X6L9I0_TRICU|nr:hypothetical protein TNCT_141321 [Trichonephila clavata]